MKGHQQLFRLAMFSLIVENTIRQCLNKQRMLVVILDEGQTWQMTLLWNPSGKGIIQWCS